MANLAEDENSRLIQGQVFIIAMMLSLTIVICWRLLSGSLTPVQSFLWLGICCFGPIAWYSFGYLATKEPLQSNALMANAIGWAFVAIAFFVHYKRSLGADLNVDNPASNTALIILLLLGFSAIVIGGLFSWQAARSAQSPEADFIP